MAEQGAVGVTALHRQDACNVGEFTPLSAVAVDGEEWEMTRGTGRSARQRESEGLTGWGRQVSGRGKW